MEFTEIVSELKLVKTKETLPLYFNEGTFNFCSIDFFEFLSILKWTWHQAGLWLFQGFEILRLNLPYDGRVHRSRRYVGIRWCDVVTCYRTWLADYVYSVYCVYSVTLRVTRWTARVDTVCPVPLLNPEMWMEESKTLTVYHKLLYLIETFFYCWFHVNWSLLNLLPFSQAHLNKFGK